MYGSKRRFATALVVAVTLAACGGGQSGTEPGEGQATATEPASEQTTAPAADVVLTGTASFEFEPSEVQAEAGTISVALTSTGGPHTFTLDLEEGAETVAQVFSPAETDIGEIELGAGTYVFFCTIPGHREEGMAGTLTVT